jgi:hypothetical protein
MGDVPLIPFCTVHELLAFHSRDLLEGHRVEPTELFSWLAKLPMCGR